MFREFTRSLFGAFMLAMALGTLGCGTATDSDRPTTYPVSGTVTMNGQPVADANVNFQLADGTRGALGVTDAQGRYELTTFTAGDGALPGEYSVVITKYEKAPPGTEASEDDPDYDPFAPAFEPKNLLPERYANPQTSNLSATIAEEPTTVDFQLTD